MTPQNGKKAKKGKSGVKDERFWYKNTLKKEKKIGVKIEKYSTELKNTPRNTPQN